MIPTQEKENQTQKAQTSKSNQQSLYTGEEAFRDSIGTLTADGKRRWIYPQTVKGVLANTRNIVAIILLLILFSGPFIELNGHPLMLFNIIERKFILFGQPFWPQDFHLLVLAMIIGIVSIIVFTVVYGRLFCGWVCPQTIFMEFVFRRIEEWIEGTANQRKKLDVAPWNTEKIIKKTAKHSIFYALSFMISNIFLAYIIGKEQWFKIISDNPKEHIAGLGIMVAFSAVFYLVFARLREQVCIAACPYGRLQGVFLDHNSIVIAYDFVRGEPRGPIRKNETRTFGDCIDCNRCVQVCPTGIDIRNGTQLECINCTACIDACNEVMQKVSLPQGLIRYASQNQITKNEKKVFTTRTFAYSVVLTLLLIIEGFLIFNRSETETTLLRMPGTLYTVQPDGMVTNLFQYHIANKTYDKQNLELKPTNPNAQITFIGKSNQQFIQVEGQMLGEGTIMVSLPKQALTGIKTELNFEIRRNNQVLETVKTNFVGPVH